MMMIRNVRTGEQRSLADGEMLPDGWAAIVPLRCMDADKPNVAPTRHSKEPLIPKSFAYTPAQAEMVEKAHQEANVQLEQQWKKGNQK